MKSYEWAIIGSGISGISVAEILAREGLVREGFAWQTYSEECLFKKLFRGIFVAGMLA